MADATELWSLCSILGGVKQATNVLASYFASTFIPTLESRDTAAVKRYAEHRVKVLCLMMDHADECFAGCKGRNVTNFKQQGQQQGQQGQQGQQHRSGGGAAAGGGGGGGAAAAAGAGGDATTLNRTGSGVFAAVSPRARRAANNWTRALIEEKVRLR